MKLDVVEGPYTITGRGSLYVVKLPKVMTTEEIVGAEFEVAGEHRRALGVERFRATWWHQPSDEVGILFSDPL